MRSKKQFIILLAILNLLVYLALVCASAGLTDRVSSLSAAVPNAVEQSLSLPALTLPTRDATSQPTSTATAVILAYPTSTPTETPLLTPTDLSTVAPIAVATHTPATTQTSNSTTCACERACPCVIEHVVIISVDGLRPDALEQADTPTLDALRAQGAYSPAAQAVLPSVTLVNHASMLGGMSPEKHGIFWNSNEPDLGKVNGPTLFSEAHEAGLSTAMIVGKPKLEHLVLPGSVDNYIYAGFTDRQVVNEAVPVIQAGLPDLLFIHLPGVDTAGHALGWMSTGQLLALNLTDGMIGEVVAALEAHDYLSQTLLIITADHGGSGFKHGSDSPEDMTIPWLVVGPGVPAGVTLQREIITYDTAATALYAFGLPIPEVWDGQPVLEIFDTPSRQK
jgi:hypothetical protein